MKPGYLNVFALSLHCMICGVFLHDNSWFGLIYFFLNLFFGMMNSWFLYSILNDRVDKIYSMLNDITTIKMASGESLNKYGADYGIKRRSFGLEPDFIYRKRLLKLITLIVNDNMGDVSIKKNVLKNRVMNWLNRVKWG